MSRRNVFREQVWPLAVVAFFFVAVTCAAFVLAGGGR